MAARNSSAKYKNTGIDFVYPFYEKEYLQECRHLLSTDDKLKARLERRDLYSLFHDSLLCVSIPYSDSSPRSVYEAIFCGAPVVVTQEDYICDLPHSMRERIIVVDLDDPGWLDSSIEQALILHSNRFSPCEEALTAYDQVCSFKRLYDLSLTAVHHAMQ
jgi:hypothetical protein